MRKRILLLALLCLSLTAGSVGLGGPASAGPTDPTVMFGGRPTGNSSSSVLSLESLTGRQLAAVRVYYLWDSPFPDTYSTWLVNNNRPMFLSVKAKRTNGQIVLWRSIADAQPGSTLHNDIVRWANRLKAIPRRVYFIFNHEPEAATNLNNGTASDFIAAWRKVITVLRQQGVTNAEYVWTMTDYSFWVQDRRRASLWYPGDEYVDHLGADAYNWYNCRPGVNTAWKSLQQIINPFRLFGQAHPTKGLMLPEWASTEDPAQPGRKAQWYADARALFKQPGWEQFNAVLYYHYRSNFANCTWFVNSSQSALDAWRAMAGDVYYSRTSP
jgi:Glycosyl hydrolase family 26